MSRRLRVEFRVEFEDAPYQVMSRGNERRRIVRDDADRAKRLDWLRRTVETYRWRLHAFALTDNHDHLFVETPEPHHSAGMQLLNGSYTSYFNRRHHRVGHLFQGRYKAHFVDDEGYFLEVSRYLHLNPVRAGIVDRPEQYRWSSHPGYHRETKAVKWVTYGQVLREFGTKRKKAARAAYRQFVAAGIDEKLPSPFRECTRSSDSRKRDSDPSRTPDVGGDGTRCCDPNAEAKSTSALPG